MSNSTSLHRIQNFSAGPATLPLSVLEKAQADLVNFQGCGMSVMEMSHRSPVYDAIHQGLIGSLRRLLSIPETHDILLLQGGASLQFAMVPMNLLSKGQSADYVLTGTWAKKALAEAQKVGRARISGTSVQDSLTRLPRQDELKASEEAAYQHFTTNNTVAGTQWATIPESPSPVVLDASSDILSRPIDFENLDLVYAGAQKNLGPAGLTLVIVRKETLSRVPEGLATMLDYRTHADKGSLFNTPPCWAIYIAGLACDWLEQLGGLTAIEELNSNKADLVYSRLDRGGFYQGTVENASRSKMNLTFRIHDTDLEGIFLEEAGKAELVNLKGHRSVGGIRASLYNAMPLSGVEALGEFMDDFERRHG